MTDVLIAPPDSDAAVPVPRLAASTGVLRRHVAGLVAGPMALALFVALPPPAPITDTGMARLGLLAFAVIWWTATPLPLAMTTLAMLGLGVVVGALGPAEAYAHTTSWAMWFTVGAFGLASALNATGVSRRVVLAFLDSAWVRGSPRWFLTMFLLSAAVVTTVMGNMVVATIWLASAIRIYELLGVDRTDPFAEANTLGIIWSVNIAGTATPIGKGVNLSAMAIIASTTGVTVSVFQWSAIGITLACLLFASALIVLQFAVPAGAGAAFASPATAEYVARERQRLGPMGVAERRAIAWFGAAVVLWFVPDIARYILSPDLAAAVQRSLHITVPALLVPIAMCLTPVSGAPASDREPRQYVLTWQQWAAGVDWNIVLFIGGVVGLGNAVGQVDTGIPAYVKAVLAPWFSGLPEYAFVLLLTFSVMLVTSVVSNLVTLAIFLPLGITLSQSLQLGDPVAIGILLGIAPSLDYMLPSGTITNALVAGSGYVRVSTMMRYGVILLVLHPFVLTFVGYPLCKLILAL